MKKMIQTKGILCFSMALTLFLVACGEQNTDSQTETDATETVAFTQEESTLVYGNTQGPTNLDVAESWNSWYVTEYGIAETLYVLDENLNPQPWLASSCTMMDEYTWEIELNEGITFQNGKELDAQAVMECWERTLEENVRLSEVLYIDTMEAEGLTLTVTTTKPVPSFINSLCEPLTAVVDVESEDMENAPIGTGPYMVESFEADNQTTVVAYADYWGGTPALDRVTFEVLGDSQSVSMALQSGDIDVAINIPSASLEIFEEDEDYIVSAATGGRAEVIFINFDNLYLQDKALRQALSMIIDKESYAEVLNDGNSTSTEGLYPDFTDYAAEEGTGPSYDPEAAAEILAEAGYVDSDGDGYLEQDGDGENVSLRLATYSARSELSSYCEEICAAAAEIGIDLTLEVYEDVTEQESTGDFDLLMVSFNMMPTGDPQYFADLAFKSDGSCNYGHYANEEVDALIETLDCEFDAQTRTDLVLEIQEQVMEDVGFIVVGHANFTIVMNADVINLEANASEYYLLDQDVSIESE